MIKSFFTFYFQFTSAHHHWSSHSNTGPLIRNIPWQLAMMQWHGNCGSKGTATVTVRIRWQGYSGKGMAARLQQQGYSSKGMEARVWQRGHGGKGMTTAITMIWWWRQQGWWCGDNEYDGAWWGWVWWCSDNNKDDGVVTMSMMVHDKDEYDGAVTTIRMMVQWRQWVWWCSDNDDVGWWRVTMMRTVQWW